MLSIIISAAIAAATAVSPTYHENICQLTPHGDAQHCVRVDRHSSRIAQWIPGRTTVSEFDCYLSYPRVNGRHGHWNYDGTLLRWQRGHITFNGVTFVNYSHQGVNLYAEC